MCECFLNARNSGDNSKTPHKSATSGFQALGMMCAVQADSVYSLHAFLLLYMIKLKHFPLFVKCVFFKEATQLSLKQCYKASQSRKIHDELTAWYLRNTAEV